MPERELEIPYLVRVPEQGCPFQAKALVCLSPAQASESLSQCPSLAPVQDYPLRVLAQANPPAGFAMGHRHRRRHIRSAPQPGCPKESN